jgi:hypothetical protein
VRRRNHCTELHIDGESVLKEIQRNIFWTCELVCASLSERDIDSFVNMKNFLNSGFWHMLVTEITMQYIAVNTENHNPLNVWCTFRDILDKASGKFLFRRGNYTCILAFFLPGKFNKWVTNGSKTSVMDIICFIYVLLGSSKVQLHDSLVSRRACTCSEAGFSSQNGDHAWGVFYRRAAFCCAFLWAKGLDAKDIHK